MNSSDIQWIQCLLGITLMMAVNGQGLKLNIDLETFSSIDDDTYSRLTCTGVGGDVTIDSFTVTRMRGTADTTQLLTISKHRPSNEVIFDNIRGTGTLEKNIAHTKLKLFSARPDLPEEFYTCQARFSNESGGVETAFAMVGPGIGNLPSQWPKTLKPLNRPDGEVNAFSGAHLSISELGFLNDKLARLEQKVDGLDERLSSKLHSYGQRLGTLESDALVKVGSVETNLSLRLSRLEERLSAMVPEVGSDFEKQLKAMQKQVDAIRSSCLDHKNESQPNLRVKVQPTVCERGMGDDVTKDYPKYAVLHNSVINKDILCDTYTDGGGWIVFQRRAHGDVDFYRDWTSYREGFGSPTGDFWMGNEAIHQLTDGEAYELRIDLRSQGQQKFAAYSSVHLESEANNYRLKFGSFTGTAANALGQHNNRPFSTFDRDHDTNKGNCAVNHHGAWWYYDCYKSNLNGKWGVKEPKGNVWDWKKGQTPVSFSEMKIRRVQGPIVA